MNYENMSDGKSCWYLEAAALVAPVSDSIILPVEKSVSPVNSPVRGYSDPSTLWEEYEDSILSGGL